MHSMTSHLNIDELIKAEPIQPTLGLKKLMWLCVFIGLVALTYGVVVLPPKQFWGSYYTNLFFWTGISCGMVILCAIFQIVRAEWTPPLRRIAESGVSFLPFAYIGFWFSYLGKDYLFFWGTQPMPGREFWFQPGLVYGRVGLALALLFFMMWRFVKMSVRADVGTIREKASEIDRWHNSQYDNLIGEWKGSAVESIETQRRLSWNAPLLILIYAVAYSLFSFDMLMAMDPVWFSNMFGGYVFLANIYTGLAMIALTAMYLASRHREYAKVLTGQQMWDLGKMTFGFCMLWGYTFFCQFLPQWYANLPEETQWMILRTREMPWQGLGWIVFGMCFILPFVMLLSRDVKRTPRAYSTVAVIILVGIWLEKYLIIAPQLYPTTIPLGLFDVGLTLGFLGCFVLCVHSFLARYPYVPVGSPLSRGSKEW